MKKNKVALVFIAIILVLVGIGGTKKVIEMRLETQKERQIAFLKAHEQEMTDYVENRSRYVIINKYNITDVKYDWNQ